MPDKNILKHHSALRGRGAQNALPRYRLRSQTGNPDYVFAAHLKRAPYWLVISGEWWGMMKDEQFELDYVTSNDESRVQPKKTEAD